jgi:hypothetical protein
MGAVLIELLPLTVAAALLPIWIIMTLFLLRGEGGLRKASAFIAGAVGVRLLQGVLFGLVLGSDETGGNDRASAIKATLLLVVGILMLIAAYKKWRKEEDPDGPPPKWMSTLGGLSAVKALGMGALLMTVAIKQWVFTLSALAIIDEGQVGLSAGLLLFLLFVAGAQSLTVTPILVAALAPAQAGRLLDGAQGWLERNSRVITIAVSLVFGIWFFWKGVTGLIG